jgi:Domain of unknown function (DUF4203)
MQEVIVGVIAILVGAALCFRGYLLMRIIIPIWGAFAGFVLGAGLVATGDDGFLRTGLAWAVGFGFALVFGLLAYLYYEFSVLLTMASIGFVLGVSLMTALGVDWQWLVVLVGIVVGVVLATLAIVGELPMLLLTVLSSMAGASLILGGIALLTSAVELEQLGENGTITETINRGPWWFILFGGLTVVGIVLQVRYLDDMRRSVRAQWEYERGRSSEGSSI